MKEIETPTLGFVWWELWATLNLTIGNVFVAAAFSNHTEAAIFFVTLYTVLYVLVYKKNKYAFLIATIMSGPLSWIVNGIYQKNRWGHPDANQKSIALSKIRTGWWESDKSFRLVIVSSITWAFTAYYLQDRYERDLSLVFVPSVGMFVFYFAYKHLVQPSKQQ